MTYWSCGKGGGIFRCIGGQGNTATSTNNCTGTVYFHDLDIAGCISKGSCSGCGCVQGKWGIPVSNATKCLVPINYSLSFGYIK